MVLFAKRLLDWLSLKLGTCGCLVTLGNKMFDCRLFSSERNSSAVVPLSVTSAEIFRSVADGNKAGPVNEEMYSAQQSGQYYNHIYIPFPPAF